jgi:hypothetical protein
MSFMHDATLQVTDNAIAGWDKLCPDLNLEAELKEQPWVMLHERSPDITLGHYWLLPCGIVAVIKKTIFYSPKGRQIRSRLRLVKFLPVKACRKARTLPEPKKITLTDEAWRRERRSHEKRQRKRRQARKLASQTVATS